MKLNNFFCIFLIIFFCASCSKNIPKENVINEKNLDLQVIETYKQGMASLKRGDVLFAAKKFNEAEILFPQSEWAPKAALMAAFSYYSQDYYVDAIAELERFIKVYPKHKNLDYAHYLLAISYYEQIVDEKKDLQSIINAKENFNIILEIITSHKKVKDVYLHIDRVLRSTQKTSTKSTLEFTNNNLAGLVQTYCGSRLDLIVIGVESSNGTTVHFDSGEATAANALVPTLKYSYEAQP